jgi:hypothetical protein
MTALTVGRSQALLLAGAPVLLGAALYAWQQPSLTTDTGFRITAPSDSGTVRQDLVLAWTKARGASSYAVVVDVALPEPGAVAVPGDRVVTLPGRLLALHLGRATTGSPSARAMHTLTVVPLDAAGRRVGEDVASVRVRTRP